MIDLKKREELDRTVLQSPWDEADFRGIIQTDWPFVTHYRNDAAEVNTWIREAVRLMEGEAAMHEICDEDDLAGLLRAHIAKVKLEES